MQIPPAFFAAAAVIATAGIGQILPPTVYAQTMHAARSRPAPTQPPVQSPTQAGDYRVRVEGLTLLSAGGAWEINGRVVNTGRKTLTYTSVVALLTSPSGQEIGRGDGYLTAGPLTPRQSAEVRAAIPAISARDHKQFAHAALTLREAGQNVAIENAGQPLR